MSATAQHAARSVAVIGGGPAGLMAADVLSAAGIAVDLYDAMPSVGRKFLLAGKGGLNLTHAEAHEMLSRRYSPETPMLRAALDAFDATAVRAWARELGTETFVGSSGRVFPVDLKAAPLLRAWLLRLRRWGVVVHTRHRWLGWAAEPPAPGCLRFATPVGDVTVRPAATVLALGGASWPQLGSDGAWVPMLQARRVAIAPLRAANCGFDVGRLKSDGAIDAGWSAYFEQHQAGRPLKNVAFALADPHRANHVFVRGECVVTMHGIEGSLVYAVSAALRETIAAHGSARVLIDLLPARSAGMVAAEVARPRGSRTLSTHLKSRLALDGVKTALLYELLPKSVLADASALAAAIKELPLTVVAPRPVGEAISTAGGVRFDALDADWMLCALEGVHCAGEMLDWEAPTGGYLLTACLASGRAAADGVLRRLGQPAST